jgi:hypothetical protein
VNPDSKKEEWRDKNGEWKDGKEKGEMKEVIGGE